LGKIPGHSRNFWSGPGREPNNPILEPGFYPWFGKFSLYLYSLGNLVPRDFRVKFPVGPKFREKTAGSSESFLGKLFPPWDFFWRVLLKPGGSSFSPTGGGGRVYLHGGALVKRGFLWGTTNFPLFLSRI